MKHLFSKVGSQLLESLAFTRTLYAFDFDGTLAPIVAKPEDARSPSEISELLSELATLAPVVVISGRAVADLRGRVDLPGDRLIGNHGLEGLGDRADSVRTAKVLCRRWFKQLTDGWGRLGDDSGTFIENKTYSLALHYRKSRNKKRARSELFALIDGLQPSPRIILGKCVINLLPAGAPHKGVALLDAMLRFDAKSSFYIGDDDTDEDVFALPDSRVITARVGVRKTSQAMFYLKRQAEMNRLLRALVKLHRSRVSVR